MRKCGNMKSDLHFLLCQRAKLCKLKALCGTFLLSAPKSTKIITLLNFLCRKLAGFSLQTRLNLSVNLNIQD